jgi:hypothetical protein
MSNLTGADGGPHRQDSAMDNASSGSRAIDRLGRTGRRALDRVSRLARPSRFSRDRRLSGAQRRLTIVIVLAPLLAWCCSLPAGAAFSPGTLIVVAIFTVFTAVRPDSPAGLSAVLFLGWHWVSQVPTHTGDPVSPWALGAGLSLLAFHTAAAARATAPGRADLDRAFWRRWSRRVAIIAAATVGVWSLSLAMASRHPGRESLTLAAFAIIVGGTACAWWIVTRPTRT